MRLLGDVPAIRLRAPVATPIPRPAAPAFAAAREVSGNAVEAARAAAEVAGSDFVVAIDPSVEPSPSAEALMPEPDLVAARICLGFPSRSVVTGLIVPRGLRLIPVARLEGDALPEPALLVPFPAGDFAANGSPQEAFRAGFALAAETPVPGPEEIAARNRLALAAALGADAMNGTWWILGTLHALLGRSTLQESWADSAPLLSEPSELSRRSRELSRLVRLERGLPVPPLDRRQSRAVKAMLSGAAPPEMWARFIAGAGDLGAAGAALALRYRRAADLIWSGAA